MEKQSITINRALSELKVIDSRIDKAIQEITPSSVIKKGGKVDNYLTVDEFNKKAQSGYDSAVALIKRKADIKSAIVLSNSKTNVTIAGKQMTVADAINQKSMILQKQTLINTLNTRHGQSKILLQKNIDIVEANLQRILEGSFNVDQIKKGGDQVDAITTPFRAANEWQLVDPLKVDEKVLELQKEVSDFIVEIDAALSDSNAITKIEI